MSDRDQFLEVTQRLKTALALASDATLAERLGLSRTAFAERKRRGALPEKEIAELCSSAGLSAQWVATGDGSAWTRPNAGMDALKKAQAVVQPLNLPDQRARTLSEALTYVYLRDRGRIEALIDRLNLALAPRYGVAASAGAGQHVEVHDEAIVDLLAFRRENLRELGVSPNHVAVIAVKGDSMADTLQDGDLIIVDTSPPERRAPGVYVLQREEALLVKRLNFKLNGSVEIRSDNKAYPTETVSAPEFASLRIVGRMVRRVVR